MMMMKLPDLADLVDRLFNLVDRVLYYLLTFAAVAAFFAVVFGS